MGVSVARVHVRQRHTPTLYEFERDCVVKKDTNIGWLSWEELSAEELRTTGCERHMTWTVKPNKTNPIGAEIFDKFFLLDEHKDAISVTENARLMLDIRQCVRKMHMLDS